MKETIKLYGKNHWSLLLYVEVRNVDNDCFLDRVHLNNKDFDLLDQFESDELVTNLGTGVNPRVKLTDLGWELSARLRKHRGQGKRLVDFAV